MTLCTLLYSQNTGSVTGRVIDIQNGEVLPGATIEIKGSHTLTFTHKDGYFTFRKLSAGRITLLVSCVGYETMEFTATVVNDRVTTVNAAMTVDNKVGNEVVVAASKRAEKVLNAPASVQVIGRRELEQFAGSNVFEMFSKVQGVEFVRTGVDYIAINARGFYTLGNNKFFQLVDGRNTMSTVSVGLPLYNLASFNKEDVETVEIILGPQSALYGPNVYHGLVYINTKDPRKYQGTTVAVSAGNMAQFNARFRQAAKIDDRWAYKLTGEYATGKDFEFHDSVYAGDQTGTPYFGPPVAIPERNVDFNFRHIRGEAYLYYRFAQKANIIFSGGGAENNFLGVSGSGRNQMRASRTSFLQAKVEHPNYFVTIYNTWGNIGSSYSVSSYTADFWNRTHSSLPPDSVNGRLSPDEAEAYALRYGNRFKEKNQRLNGEAQYNHFFEKPGLFFVAGLSYQKDKPNSYGYTLVDKEKNIRVTQYGAVLLAEKTFRHGIRLTSAGRLDHHSNFGNFFSPKVGVIKKTGDGNFRITWAKAYAMPSIFFQYGNFSGVAFGNGPGVVYYPDSTAYPTVIAKTTALKPEETATWEIGYKGRIATKLFFDVSSYYSSIKNFMSPPLPVDGRAFSVGDIPVDPAIPGTVDPITHILHGARFFTLFNYGSVNAYGVDAGLNYSIGSRVNLDLKYSWFDSNITKNSTNHDGNKDGAVTADERSLNAPKQKIILQLNLVQLFKKKASMNISARYTEQSDFYSFNQIGTASGKGHRGSPDKNFDWGPLGGFTVVDMNAAYQVNETINLNLNITNLFDVQQRESVGSPPIGRLFMVELKVHVPDKK